MKQRFSNIIRMPVYVACLCCMLSVAALEARLSAMTQTQKHDAEQGEQFYQKHYQNVISNPQASISDLKQSAEYFTKAAQVMKAASALARIGQIYTTLGMHNLALEYLLEVHQMLKDQPSSSQVAWLYSDIGNVYFAMQQVDLAEPYYVQGLKMMKDVKDVFGQSVMLNNIGLCKMKQSKPDIALSYYKKSLRLRESTNDRFAIYHSLNYLGETYQSMGDYGQALQYFQKVFKDLKNPAEPKDASNSLRATTALSLHKLFLQQNQALLADKYLDEAINIYTYEHDLFRLNDALKLKAECLYKQDRIDLASDIYAQIFSVAKNNGFPEQAKNAAYQLGTIYLQQDKHTLATQYWQYYTAYYDSLYAMRSPETLVRLHSSVQNNLKEIENKELKSKQQVNAKFTIITLILLGIIILLFVRAGWANKKYIRRLRQLADASYEGIIIHDKGLILEVNNQFIEILGVKREDCISHSIMEVTNLVLDDTLPDRLKADGIQNYELIANSAKKGLLTLEVMSRPYTYGKHKVRVAAIRDITERKKFLTTLLDNRRQLSELNATKDKLFSIIAHDLKNPFSAIIGFAEVLRHNIDKFTLTQIHEMIIQIHDTSNSAFALLQNLLEWAVIQTGAVSIFPYRQKLLPVINDAASIVNASLASKGISLNISCAEDTMITADKHMLLSILNNLLSNAVKFTPANGNITISAYQNGQTTISVSDTGIGMSAELVGDLFSIESISSRKGTNNESGTGIGLILCKEMIDMHKGNMTVNSTPGKGTEFQVSFPA